MAVQDDFGASVGAVLNEGDVGRLDIAPVRDALVSHVQQEDTGLTGLTIRAIEHVEADAFASPSLNAVSINWVLRGVHDDGPFLGWGGVRGTRFMEPTLQEVVLLVHSVGRQTATGGWEFVSRWDTLGGLGQIGILAVGRPVVPHRFSPNPDSENPWDAPIAEESSVPETKGYTIAAKYAPNGNGLPVS